MNRNNIKCAEKTKRQAIGFNWNRGIFSAEQCNLQLLAEYGQKVALCDVAEVDQDTPQFVPALLLEGQSIFEVVFRDQSTLEQKLAERSCFCGQQGLHLYSTTLTSDE